MTQPGLRDHFDVQINRQIVAEAHDRREPQGRKRRDHRHGGGIAPRRAGRCRYRRSQHDDVTRRSGRDRPLPTLSAIIPGSVARQVHSAAAKAGAAPSPATIAARSRARLPITTSRVARVSPRAIGPIEMLLHPVADRLHHLAAGRGSRQHRQSL